MFVMSCAAWLPYSVGTAQDWALHDFMSSFVGEAEPDWVHISENYVHLPIFCLTGQLLYESLTEDSAPMVTTSDCPVISHLLITEFAPLWEQLLFPPLSHCSMIHCASQATPMQLFVAVYARGEPGNCSPASEVLPTTLCHESRVLTIYQLQL